MSFLDFDFDLELVQAILDTGVETPREIQQKVIPLALDGQDIIAAAPTGSGKTLAYLAPALQHIADNYEAEPESPRVLVLVPTRELAAQAERVWQALTTSLEFSSSVIVGGTPYGNQQQMLSDGMHLLVATPGRLLELDEKGWLDLSLTDMLIIDEADRMLDMGFVDSVATISQLCADQRQTMMFSATVEGERMSKFARRILKPETEEIKVGGKRTLAGNLEQKAFRVDNDEHKNKLLLALLQQPDLDQVIVFANTRKQVEVTTALIRDAGYMCDGLHGDLPQGERTKRLKNLRRKRVQILVSTDIAARGLDLATISMVINFQLPGKADAYLHRAGRAGRYEGGTGLVCSLVDTNDLPMLGKIERYQKLAISRDTIKGLEPTKPEKVKPKKSKPKKNGKAKSSNKKKAAKKK